MPLLRLFTKRRKEQDSEEKVINIIREAYYLLENAANAEEKEYRRQQLHKVLSLVEKRNLNDREASIV